MQIGCHKVLGRVVGRDAAAEFTLAFVEEDLQVVLVRSCQEVKGKTRASNLVGVEEPEDKIRTYFFKSFKTLVHWSEK